MATYQTLDYILDLTPNEISSAINIDLKPTTNDPKYDISGLLVGVADAPFDAVYKFSAIEGATYSIIDTSFFDPNLRVYDSSGNAITTNSESIDLLGESMFASKLRYPDGGTYSLDIVLEWVAPYTGTVYVKPGWELGSFYKYYGIVVSGDLDTAPTLPPPDPIITPTLSNVDRVFGWAESVYGDLFPEHQESRADVFGYYARLYSNGDALGEQNGNIYYYDGGAGGTGEITLVGTVADYMPQATTAGF